MWNKKCLVWICDILLPVLLLLQILLNKLPVKELLEFLSSPGEPVSFGLNGLVRGRRDVPSPKVFQVPSCPKSLVVPSPPSRGSNPLTYQCCKEKGFLWGFWQIYIGQIRHIGSDLFFFKSLSPISVLIALQHLTPLILLMWLLLLNVRSKPTNALSGGWRKWFWKRTSWNNLGNGWSKSIALENKVVINFD